MAVDLMPILPEYFRKVLEFKELMRVDGEALEDFEALTGQVRDNNYILTCDEATITWYERLLHITGTAGEAMESRRRMVILRLNQQIPYTMPRLKEILTELLGSGGFRLDTSGFREYQFKVEILNQSDGVYGAIEEMLRNWIPAHILLAMNSVSVRRREAPIYTGSARSEYIRIYAKPENENINYKAAARIRIGTGACTYYRSEYLPEGGN